MLRLICCSGWRVKRRSFPRSLLKSQCDACGSKLALELDHWDNNPSNDDPSNAATLCHACHELKTQLSKEKGAARAAATRNAIFRQTVEGAAELIGADKFRTRRDTENQEWLDERSVRAARQKAGHYVEVTEYKCANSRRAHEFRHRSDEPYEGPDDWCEFCHMPLKVAREYRLHRRLEPGKGWVETTIEEPAVIRPSTQAPSAPTTTNPALVALGVLALRAVLTSLGIRPRGKSGRRGGRSRGYRRR